MNARIKSCLGLAGALLLVQQSALAQKVNQPWTSPRGAHESRVISCTNPNPPAAGQVAMDDWICPGSGPITRVQWWGVVSTPAQLNRQYEISIWNHSAAACRPSNRVYLACVQPTAIAVGTDCRQRTVYRFSAALPAPYFTQVTGTHYWLQIAENDAASVNPGAIDFRWSSHVPISPAPLCPALHLSGGGVVTQPAPDDCPQPINTDLAFRLFGTTVVGFIPIPLPGPSVFMLQLEDTAGNIMERIPVEPSADGSFEVEPDSPPGVYRVRMIGMGLNGMRGMLTLEPDSENPIALTPPCLADFNGDGAANSQDFFDFLNIFFAGCP